MLSYISFFVSVFTLTQAQMTYWVDDSCRPSNANNQFHFDTVMADTQDMCATAQNGLQWTHVDARKVYYDYYFHKLFGAPRTARDLDFQTILSFYNNIEFLQPVPGNDRARSNIRVYCDEDARFSDRQQNGDLHDPVNGIIQRHATQGCSDGHTEAETYQDTFYKPGEAVPRASITICNVGLAYAHTVQTRTDRLRAEMPCDTDVDGKFNEVTSRVLLHELTHINGMGSIHIPYTRGAYVAGGEPRMWGPIGGDSLIGIGRDLAIQNAETYAKAALLCMAIELNWKMDLRETRYGMMVPEAPAIGDRPRPGSPP